eukprot:PLAT9424.4.p1 GENE.PLAT9424.4~~PLAT9424.4.p1  ORF type:complete len:600 (+),score=347.42 PLAT9424.4:48-1847(+)
MSKHRPSAEDVTEEELAELRNRFHLLQGDRKAFFETSQRVKEQNAALMADLRQENKDLRKGLAALQKEAGRAGPSPDAAEVDSYTRQLLKLRQGYDTAKARVLSRKKELQALRDKFEELEGDAKPAHAEDSPLTRKIRMLENRLDKAMIKFNEAQSIRKTYEQIVKRLQEERVGFDNQLGAIERTLAAKKHDAEELKLLAQDATHARESALVELERVKDGYEKSRKERELQLAERKHLVAYKTDLAKRMESRERTRADVVADKEGELTESEEKDLKRAVAMNKITASRMAEESKEQKRKIDVYERAFAKIKDATGVDDVNEVIQKITSQEDTHNNLVDLTKENQLKIEGLNEEKARLKARVEEMKYSGPGGSHRRKMVDDYEEALTASGAKLERVRVKYERLAKVLISIKSGVEHLWDKLESVRGDGRHPTGLADNPIVEMLFQCESTLLSLLHRIESREESKDGAEHTVAALVSDLGAGITDDELLKTRPNNQRIHLPAEEEEEEDEDDLTDDDDDDALDGEEEELTREKIKKASSQLLAAQDRRKRKGKKPRRGAGGGGGGGANEEKTYEHGHALPQAPDQPQDVDHLHRPDLPLVS